VSGYQSVSKSLLSDCTKCLAAQSEFDELEEMEKGEREYELVRKDKM
jgi:hypothetical protein